MSISTAAKIGGAGLFSAGVPTTIYLAKDHIFLYEIERDVLKDDVKLTVGEPTENTGTDVKIEVKVSNSTTWSCVIKAEVLDSSGAKATETDAKTKFQKYIKQRIPVTPGDTESSSTPAIEENTKKANKKKLVWDCSGNRLSVSSDTITSELSIQLRKTSDNKLMTTLFGEEENLSDN